MSRGEYEINKSPKPSKDGSFKSMLCALLVFFCICIILLLAAWPWKSYSSAPTVGGKNEDFAPEKDYVIYNAKHNETTTTSSPKDVEVVDSNKPFDETLVLFGKLKEAPDTTTFRSEVKTTERAHGFPVTEDRLYLWSYGTTNKAETTTENTGDYKPITKTVVAEHNITYIWLTEHTTQKNIADVMTEMPNTETIQTTTPDKIKVNEKTTIDYDIDETTTPGLQMYKEILSLTTTNSPGISEQHTTIVSDSYDSTTVKIEEKIQNNTESNRAIATVEPSVNAETILPTLIVSEEDATVINTDVTTSKVEEEMLEVSSQPYEEETELSSLEMETTLSSATAIEINTEGSTITLASIEENYSTEQTEIVQIAIETTIVALERNSTDFISTPTTEKNIREQAIENINKSTTKVNNLETTTISDSVTNHPIIFLKMREEKTTTEQAETPIMMIETDYTEPSVVTKPPKKIVKEEICDTVDAKKIASEMLYLMDHSVDACDDFYQFSCGANQKKEKTSELKMLDAISEVLENQNQTSSEKDVQFFRNFYEQCYNYHIDAFDYKQRVLNVTKIIQSIGKPFEDTDMDNDLLSNLTIKLMEYDYSPFFDISIDINKTTKQNIFEITLGNYMDESYKLKHRKKCIQYMKKRQTEITDLNEMYKIFLQCTQTYSDYLKEVEAVLRELSIFSMEQIHSTMKIISVILKKYNENLPAPAYVRSDIVNKNYNINNIEELNNNFPIFKWQDFLSILSGKQIKEQDDVHVYYKDFFKDLFCLKDIKIRDFYNAQLAMFSHNLYRKFVIPAPNNVKKHCLSQTSKLLKTTASKLYISSFSDLDLKSNISAIKSVFSRLKSEFIKEDFEWVETEAADIDNKIELMQLEINVDMWKQGIEKDLEEVVDNYQELNLALIKRNRRKSWNSMQIPSDKSLFSIFALNKIVATPLILTEVIPKDIPLYISNARLGYILAKEIGHHFDTIGITYGVNLQGNSKKAYDNLEICSTQKYSAPAMLRFQGRQYIYQINQTLHLTLNDRIAEDLAIKLLSNMTNDLVADKKIVWLSELFPKNQILYIAAAQVKCRKLSMEDFLLELFESEVLPPSLLLQMSLSNLQSFQETFKCPAGSSMAHPLECKAFQDLEKADEDDDYGE